MSDALVMTSGALRDTMADELKPVPAHRIIGEPVGRNTAPAIALAAKLLASDDPDAVMVVLPADHVIGDDEAFRATIGLAARAAEMKRALVTLGIRPTRPETEYGYIRAGSACDLPGVLEVASFEEKPDRRRAEEYLEAGGYYWNSGMFVWRADDFLAEVERHLPDVAGALAGVTCGPGDCRLRRGAGTILRFGARGSPSTTASWRRRTESSWSRPTSVGTTSARGRRVARIWAGDDDGNTVRGDALVIDSNDCIVYSESGTVAVLGMSDVVVVRTAGRYSGRAEGQGTRRPAAGRRPSVQGRDLVREVRERLSGLTAGAHGRPGRASS